MLLSKRDPSDTALTYQKPSLNAGGPFSLLNSPLKETKALGGGAIGLTLDKNRLKTLVFVKGIRYELDAPSPP